MNRTLYILCFLLARVISFPCQAQTFDLYMKEERVSQFGKNSDMVSMNPIFRLENNTIHNKNKSQVIVKLPKELKDADLAYGFLFFTGNKNPYFQNEVVFLVKDYNSESPKIYVDSNGNLDFTDDEKHVDFSKDKLQVKLKNEFKPTGYLSYQIYKSQIKEVNNDRLLSRYKGKYPKSSILHTKHWFTSERLSVNISSHKLNGRSITILTYDGNADGLLKFDAGPYGDRIVIKDQEISSSQDLSSFIRTAEPVNYSALFKIGEKTFRLQNINSDGSSLSLIPSDQKVRSKVGVGSNISDLTFTLIDGKELSIQELLKDNKPILLDFGATWCAGCVKQEKNIKKIYKSRDINVVGLFPDDKKERVESYISKKNIQWPVGLLGKELKKKLHINAYPTFMLVSKEGKILKLDMSSENIKMKLSKM